MRHQNLFNALCLMGITPTADSMELLLYSLQLEKAYGIESDRVLKEELMLLGITPNAYAVSLVKEAIQKDKENEQRPA